MVSPVVKKLCGLQIISTQISRIAKVLDDEISQRNNSPSDEVLYWAPDARYEKVHHDGSVISCEVLIAAALDADYKCTILGTNISLSEVEPHWRDFLKSLQDRGLCGVRYLVSDDYNGLKAAVGPQTPNAPWPRCQCHLQRIAMVYILKVSMRKAAHIDI